MNQFRIYKCGLLIFIIAFLISCRPNQPKEFFVDSVKGNDNNPGTIDNPFQTIDKALNVVDQRVKETIFSDKIFLRGGIYKKQSENTLYHLNLKGTPENFALFSAMPCDSTTINAVKRKSGQWYENVVFDDAWVISTPWVQTEGNKEIWKTSPGYTHLEWTNQNIWPWTSHGFLVSDKDETPKTTAFTVAPYLLLQDGDPSIWVNSVDELKEPGQHFYDHSTKTLYVWPTGYKNPNKSKIETWYGGNEDYEVGTLHLDGEGRGLFDGNIECAAIKGIEFRMFNKLFEFHRRQYNSESERIIQRDVLFEDNYCKYGWIQILLDANTVIDTIPGVITPHYSDRARWIVRNNVFYRPSREVCQLHGDDHLFEGNVIIDHLGPWAGPAACVSSVNTRNTRNFTVRNNYFIGQGNNRYHSGSVFMIESGTEHADKNGDYIFGGQTYENNLIANITSGAAFVLGKGGARLQDITIRNNIIKTNVKSPAIILGSPHKNLKIEGNIFYEQNEIIKINQFGKDLDFSSLPSSIEIKENLFVNNKLLFDEELLNAPEGSKIDINDNLFWNNTSQTVGHKIIEQDPLFNNPDDFDFRLDEGDSIKKSKSVLKQIPWWKYRNIYPKEIPVAEKQNKEKDAIQ